MTTKLTQLKLNDIGGFKDFELNFHDNLTVFIGKNGAGKTTLLKSIALLFDMGLEVALKKATLPDFDAINLTSQLGLSQYQNNPLLFDNSLQPYLSLLFSINDETVLIENQEAWGSFDFSLFSEKLSLYAAHQNALPLFLYYPAYHAPIGKIDFSDLKLENHIYAAYISACQETVFDFNRFFAWFTWQENIKREVGTNKQYDIIREAIYQVINDEQNLFDNLHITWQQNPNGDLCIEKNGTLLNINQLSAGEKMLMILVADLARRLIVANPSSEHPLQQEGVVLIDEIDLHLHPSWQRAVVPNLRKLFPNCQFIMTTHSPLILADVAPEHIVILKDFTAIQNTQHTLGRDTNSILSDIMDVPERPKGVQEKFKACFALIDNNELQQAEQTLEQLEEHLGPNDPDIVYIHSLISFYQ